jgi:hypothetical protein
MINELRFIKGNTTYFAVGQPEENYFDLGLIPLDSSPCNDILEKTRLLYGFWEKITAIDSARPKGTITNLLVIDLIKYFEQYEASDFAYWSLLEYETLKEFDTQSIAYEVDSNLVLYAKETKIIIPPPYEYIIDEEGNEFDGTDNPKIKLLIFEQSQDFPILFMSNEQKIKNESLIQKYYTDLFSIFNKYDYKYESCEDLVNYYLMHC